MVEGPLGALLAHVARHIAHYPIRVRGTFCGSLAHADPASEWCLVASTLDATMVAQSVRGERLIAAKDYFRGIMTTALAEDELLAEVGLPLLPNDAQFGFNEFSRRAGDFAMSRMSACGKRPRRKNARFRHGGSYQRGDDALLWAMTNRTSCGACVVSPERAGLDLRQPHTPTCRPA